VHGSALKEERMQTEAVSTEKSSDGKRAMAKDPVVLGVALPVSATMAAAAQLKGVWADALQALLSAAKEKASTAKSKATTTSDDSEIKA
jgi:hypothetical protein